MTNADWYQECVEAFLTTVLFNGLFYLILAGATNLVNENNLSVCVCLCDLMLHCVSIALGERHCIQTTLFVSYS